MFDKADNLNIALEIQRHLQQIIASTILIYKSGAPIILNRTVIFQKMTRKSVLTSPKRKRMTQKHTD